MGVVVRLVIWEVWEVRVFDKGRLGMGYVKGWGW